MELQSFLSPWRDLECGNPSKKSVLSWDKVFRVFCPSPSFSVLGPSECAGVGSWTGNLLSRMRENLYAEVPTPHFFVSKNFPAKTTVWRTFRGTQLFSCPCKLSLEIALCYWAYNASSGLSLATLTPTSDTKMMDCLIFMPQVVRRKGKDQRFSTQNTLVLQLHSNQLSKLYFPIHNLATLRQDK